MPLSPYARKVRLVLSEKRLPYDLRLEKVWERRPEYLEMNAAGTVPTLVEDNGLIVPEETVAMQFDEIAESFTEVIQGERPGIVAGNLNTLPGGKVLVNFATGTFNFGLHRFHLAFEINRLEFGMFPKLFELFFQLEDRLFKIEGGRFHSTTRGVLLLTKAKSSSRSAGLSIIPVAGFGAFGACGFVSEKMISPEWFVTIQRLLPR